MKMNENGWKKNIKRRQITEQTTTNNVINKRITQRQFNLYILKIKNNKKRKKSKFGKRSVVINNNGDILGIFELVCNEWIIFKIKKEKNKLIWKFHNDRNWKKRRYQLLI